MSTFHIESMGSGQYYEDDWTSGLTLLSRYIIHIKLLTQHLNKRTRRKKVNTKQRKNKYLTEEEMSDQVLQRSAHVLLRFLEMTQ